MIQLINENEIAERKPYKFSAKVLDRIRRNRESRERKRREMAQSIVRINDLTEIVPGEIIYGRVLGNTIET